MTKYYIEKEYIKVDYYIKNAKVVWCIDESGFEVFEIWQTEEWKSYLLGFLENTNCID